MVNLNIHNGTNLKALCPAVGRIMIGWDDDDDELRPMFNRGWRSYGLYDDHSYTSFIYL